ncbi:MAG: phosphoserine phosphatase SerB, partial [Methanobrevibacter sp.]|nr:phosphoserine phosphatase SerB [Methanobrevibacter sp.]
MIELVVFDLDNVIIDGEAIDEIGKLVNVQEKVAEITEQAMNGDLEFETSLKERVKLLKGASVEEIKKIASEMELMKGAKETIQRLKDKGYEVAIISGSFDLIADSLKDKIDFDHIFTNTLVESEGILTGEVTGPLVKGSKSDILSELIEEKNISLENCVAVGDGANDISMIEAAEYGIAFNAKPSVKEVADIIIENNDLTEVLTIINSLNPDENDEDAKPEELSETMEVATEEDLVDEITDSEDVAPDEEDVSTEVESLENIESEDSETENEVVVSDDVDSEGDMEAVDVDEAVEDVESEDGGTVDVATEDEVVVSDDVDSEGDMEAVDVDEAVESVESEDGGTVDVATEDEVVV